MQCVSNRCKELFKRKKYFGVIGTLKESMHSPKVGCVIPENIHTSLTEGIPETPIKLHTFKFLGLIEPPPPPPRPGNSKLFFCGESMYSSWKCTLPSMGEGREWEREDRDQKGKPRTPLLEGHKYFLQQI